MKRITALILALCLVLALAACGGKASVITVAKDKDGLKTGLTLSPEDAKAVSEIIDAAIKENGWKKDTVSNSIPSCYLSVAEGKDETVFQYSEGGVLDDHTNMRSLTLSSAGKEEMNSILSNYVELGLKRLDVPLMPLVPLNP